MWLGQTKQEYTFFKIFQHDIYTGGPTTPPKNKFARRQLNCEVWFLLEGKQWTSISCQTVFVLSIVFRNLNLSTRKKYTQEICEYCPNLL